MPEIAIIGAGVIGQSIAWELANRGASVTVLDQSTPGTEASWAGAGMLPPGNLAAAITSEGRLRGLSHQLWPDWSARLRELTGIDNGFRRCGGLELRMRGATASNSLPDLDGELDYWRAQQIHAEKLDRRGLLACEPKLSPAVDEAIFWPEMGQVRNPWHLRALQEACQLAGVQLRPHETVRELVFVGERVERLVTDTASVSSDQYIVAAGAWTSRLLGQTLAGSVAAQAVHPMRGQIVLLNQSPSPISHVLNVGPRYLVPRGDGRILCGSTEESVGFEKRNTAEGVAGLIELARSIVPDLGSATIERAWSGLRPRTADGLPLLGRHPGFSNLWIAAGHFRAGLQLSPGTAAALAPLVLGQDPIISLKGFEVDRKMPASSCELARH